MKHFPFTAIVGMESAKRSLIFHAIDPHLGGALLMGHRGCAKSTLARAFAGILESDSQKPSPFVEVPLGVTEDRLLGSVDAQKLVEGGKWQARSSLIEEAHRGVLYIDEVNLLPDHLADLILDSAANGRHRMERDGITRDVESRYILIGSMNPEEGDLRPQLSDRFAHGVRVQSDFSVAERVAIARARMQFEDDPLTLVEANASLAMDLKKRILVARQILKQVVLEEAERQDIASRARELQLEGLRPELAVLRTARCAAAWEQRLRVTSDDIEEAWILCLGHRSTPSPHSMSPPSPPAPDLPPSPRTEAPVARHPTQAEAKPRLLTAFAPAAHPSLSHWFKQSPRSPGKGNVRRNHGALDEKSADGSISWVESLKASLRAGWKPENDGWQLRSRRAVSRPKLWIFLDASRSTAMQGFLSRARDMIGGLISENKSARCHILMLKDGALRWKARHQSARGALYLLNEISEAGGKSFLARGIHCLHRQIHGRGVSRRDGVIICSDGLMSPEPPESASQAVKRLRHFLDRLTRRCAKTAWLRPEPIRGLLHWVPKLCENLPVTLFSVPFRSFR